MRLILAVSLLCLSACSLTPDYERPAVSAGESWKESDAVTVNATDIKSDWWTNFGSDELNALETEGLAQNNDLLAAIQRVEQARASVKIARAPLFPSIDASGNASRNESKSSGTPRTSRESYSVGAGISYELDLWGANRASLAGAQASYSATAFDKDALQLVVTSDIAQNYLSLVNLRERLALANTNLKNAKDILRIADARFREGATSALELSQQKTAVAGTEASLASLQQSQQNSEHALAVLLGKAPAELTVKGETLEGLIIPAITPTLPAELITHRPDIRAAEESLIAANANIGVARAALFPTLQIGADISRAANPTTTATSLAASIFAPIFQGGRLTGEVRRTKARQAELVETYRKTVLIAFQEVEDALSAVKAANAREALLKTAAEESQKAYNIARERYNAGAVDFQTQLDTQSSLLQAQDSYAQARLDRLAATITLYKALGGGWTEAKN